MITLSPEHAALRAAAALAATLALLNSGPPGAQVYIYGNTRPSNGAAAGADPLVVFVLARPAGVIADGVLTLAAANDALILLTGVAAWARIIAGGTTVLDCDVSDPTGTAMIRLAMTQLYAGGSVRMTAGVLG